MMQRFIGRPAESAGELCKMRCRRKLGPLCLLARCRHCPTASPSKCITSPQVSGPTHCCSCGPASHMHCFLVSPASRPCAASFPPSLPCRTARRCALRLSGCATSLARWWLRGRGGRRRWLTRTSLSSCWTTCRWVGAYISGRESMLTALALWVLAGWFGHMGGQGQLIPATVVRRGRSRGCQSGGLGWQAGLGWQGADAGWHLPYLALPRTLQAHKQSLQRKLQERQADVNAQQQELEATECVSGIGAVLLLRSGARRVFKAFSTCHAWLPTNVLRIGHPCHFAYKMGLAYACNLH